MSARLGRRRAQSIDAFALGYIADSLERLHHAAVQIGSAVAASGQRSDDEPAESRDGLGHGVRLGHRRAVVVWDELVAPLDRATERLGALEGERVSGFGDGDDWFVAERRSVRHLVATLEPR